MIHIKTPQQIADMTTGGKILAEVLFEALEQIKPGVTELQIDAFAQKRIIEKGGEPGFKKVAGYHHTICVATNEVVVHGIPTAYKFKEGDVVCIDCGVYYKGLHTDMAETIIVKSQTPNPKSQADEEKEKFLAAGKNALEEAIKVVKPGNKIGHISQVIQQIIEKDGGYSVVRSLIGHGVGKKLHEEPEVPGFLHGPIDKTPTLTPGMTIAIEAIYNMGGPDVVYANRDGWTIKTKDGSLSAVFERSVVVTPSGVEILTA